MKAFFTELLEYNRQMNHQLILALVAQQDRVPEKSVRLMNHILNSQEMYNARMEPVYSSHGPWHMRELAILDDVNEVFHTATKSIVSRMPLDQVIYYTTSTGIDMQHTIQDILFHVVNHATYHRGQIAMDFRNTGLEPLVTDYAVWKRYL